MGEPSEYESLEDICTEFEETSKMYDERTHVYLDGLEAICEVVENLNKETLHEIEQRHALRAAKAQQSYEMEHEVKKNRKVEETKQRLKKIEQEKEQLLYLKDEKHEERERARAQLKEASSRIEELKAVYRQLSSRESNLPMLTYVRKLLMMASSLTLTREGSSEDTENNENGKKVTGYASKPEDNDVIPFEYNLEDDNPADYVKGTWDIINS